MRPLPKTLATLVASNPTKLEEGWSEQDGYNERNPSTGWAHWLYLKRGWCWPERGAHIIHEDTVRACLRAFREVKPCTCDDCQETES